MISTFLYLFIFAESGENSWSVQCLLRLSDFRRQVEITNLHRHAKLILQSQAYAHLRSQRFNAQSIGGGQEWRSAARRKLSHQYVLVKNIVSDFSFDLNPIILIHV
jgi:hypothetical protein